MKVPSWKQFRCHGTDDRWSAAEQTYATVYCDLVPTYEHGDRRYCDRHMNNEGTQS